MAGILAAWFALSERPTWPEATGAVIVLAGLGLANLPSREGSSPPAPPAALAAVEPAP